MKLFWDTNLFIYLIEQHPEYSPKVVKLYESVRSRGDQILTSTLTLGEVIVQPLRLGRGDLATSYTVLLSQGDVTLTDFNAEAARHYALIRASTSLRQPDAIQFACAASAKVDVFFTNDQRLWDQRVPGVGKIQGLD